MYQPNTKLVKTWKIKKDVKILFYKHCNNFLLKVSYLFFKNLKVRCLKTENHLYIWCHFKKDESKEHRHYNLIVILKTHWGWINLFPSEFKLRKWIDNDTGFEKIFISKWQFSNLPRSITSEFYSNFRFKEKRKWEFLILFYLNSLIFSK